MTPMLYPKRKDDNAADNTAKTSVPVTAILERLRPEALLVPREFRMAISLLW